MEGKNFVEKYSFMFLVIIFIVGIAGHIIKQTLPLMLLLTPLTLSVGALLVVYCDVRKSRTLIGWFVLSYIITYLIEVVGVKTKLIFGNYEYGNVLGLKVLEVPIIIGINWVIVVFGAISASMRFIKNKMIVIIATGLIATSFDFLIEPVAIKLSYWNWFNNIIPLQNYLAWFVIASIISAIFINMKLSVSNSLAERYLYIQIIFFLALNLFM